MPREIGKQVVRTGKRSASTVSAPLPCNEQVYLGSHPSPPHLFGEAFQAIDGFTESEIFHRAISERAGKRAIAVSGIREMLIKHHVNPEKAKWYLEALKELGFETEQNLFRYFPKNPLTRKGNLAEVVMAEYITATTNSTVPVYRLQHNSNPDQSMKGDDVLAFDLDSNPMRIIVGEAKFRGVATADAVKEAIDGLVRSYRNRVPMSLQFVINKLFEADELDIAKKIVRCDALIIRGELTPDYMGLLLSDTKSVEKVNRKTPNSLRRLAMISLGVEDPNTLVDDCYRDLEDECLSQLT